MSKDFDNLLAIVIVSKLSPKLKAVNVVSPVGCTFFSSSEWLLTAEGQTNTYMYTHAC